MEFPKIFGTRPTHSMTGLNCFLFFPAADFFLRVTPPGFLDQNLFLFFFRNRQTGKSRQRRRATRGPGQLLAADYERGRQLVSQAPISKLPPRISTYTRECPQAVRTRIRSSAYLATIGRESPTNRNFTIVPLFQLQSLSTSVATFAPDGGDLTAANRAK